MACEDSHMFLLAINQCNFNLIQQYRMNFDLPLFVQENIYNITPEALDFLNRKCDVKLNFSDEIFYYITPQQLDICLKNNFVPSNNIILNYSIRSKLEHFLKFYDNHVLIPQEVVYQWTSPSFESALKIYLENGGNPNVRAFTLQEKYINKTIPTFLKGATRSLIDNWYFKNGDCEIVKLLKSYGALLSPYAKTKEEEEEDYYLIFNDHEKFKIKRQPLLEQLEEKLNNFYSLENTSEEIIHEYEIAVDKLRDELQ